MTFHRHFSPRAWRQEEGKIDISCMGLAPSQSSSAASCKSPTNVRLDSRMDVGRGVFESGHQPHLCIL